MDPLLAIDSAVQTIQRGGIVCFPTETTYGLAVDFANNDALAKLSELKGRGEKAPFALIVSDVDAAISVTQNWPALAGELAKRHWPGPLTIIVPARTTLSPCLVGGAGGVGMRISSNPIAHALAQRVGPITATSANPSGQPPATTMAAARRYFGDDVGTYLDGGIAQASSSTVVEVTDDNAMRVLRKGAIVLE